MKESYFFRSIKDEVEKKKEAAEVKPLTANEHEEIEQGPMMLKDYWLSLRQSVQEKLTIEEPTPEEQEKTKLLSELITPELMTEYKRILRGFNSKARKNEEHLQREFINVNSEEFADNIEGWIENLINEVKNKQETGLDENDIEELRAQCWLLFDSIGNVMNTKSLEKDIEEFYKDKTEKVDEKDGSKQKSELIKQLQGRYPLDKTEIEILVDLVRFEKDKKEDYSLKILTSEISKLWKEYRLGENKGELAKISLGYLAAKGAESFAPSLFQNLIVGDKFNLAVYLEYLGLGKVNDVIDTHVDIKLEKMINEINHQINKRMADSLFFREFEFIHEKSLGEIYVALERGKNATEQLLRDVISRFTPTLTGIALSSVFLMKINPIMGGISLCSLPVMYKIARKKSDQMHKIYEKSRRAEEKMFARIDSIKSGFEEVKTSSDVPAVAQHIGSHLNVIDNISLERTVKMRKMWLLEKLPFDAADAVSAGVGVALQQSGQISGGAVLSNIMYSRHLTHPVERLVDLYFNDFSRNIQDIRHAETIFGKYEKLDLPEGKKEKERVSVSELKNFDISIKNLRYKHILRGVNLDIKQGEFLTIIGESGEGKSTLFRNLAGLYKSDGGSIEIGGVRNDRIKKYGEESIYSAMSYCNQNPQIFEDMTLRENILLWSKKEKNDEEIRQILKDLHMDKFVDRLDEKIKTFSGGEKTRIGLARMLTKDTKIMLLDEPTTGLDSRNAKEFINIILEINAKHPNKTILCISQDNRFIEASKKVINIAELQK